MGKSWFITKFQSYLKKRGLYRAVIPLNWTFYDILHFYVVLLTNTSDLTKYLYSGQFSVLDNEHLRLRTASERILDFLQTPKTIYLLSILPIICSQFVNGMGGGYKVLKMISAFSILKYIFIKPSAHILDGASLHILQSNAEFLLFKNITFAYRG